MSQNRRSVGTQAPIELIRMIEGDGGVRRTDPSVFAVYDRELFVGIGNAHGYAVPLELRDRCLLVRVAIEIARVH